MAEKKTSNDILSESTQQICSQNIIHIDGKGLYQSCMKNCESLNFRLLAFFFFASTLEPMGIYKICDILETAGRRTSGVSI